MATKDVAVYDGSDWVSISGGDGADGKSVEFNPPGTATNVVNIDEDTPGLATLTLNLNAGLSDDDKNVYDVTMGVPVGIKGEKGDDGTGVNILGQLQQPPGTPVAGPPVQDNTQSHDICNDGPGSAWLDVDGNLWVWSSQDGGACADGNPPTYTNVGSIQGPSGDPGKAPTFTTNVAATEKTCGDYTTTVTVTSDGGTTEQPNYKLEMQLPRPVKVFSAVDNGGSPDGVSGACAGDFWLVQE